MNVCLRFRDSGEAGGRARITQTPVWRRIKVRTKPSGESIMSARTSMRLLSIKPAQRLDRIHMSAAFYFIYEEYLCTPFKVVIDCICFVNTNKFRKKKRCLNYGLSITFIEK